MIAFECPNCGNPINVDDDHAGRSAWCRKCRRISLVPRPNGSNAAAPAPGSVPIAKPVADLGGPLHPGGVPVSQPISQLADAPAVSPRPVSGETIDLKHIQPAAREEVRQQVQQATSEVARLSQQRSEAIQLLQESAAEISRLVGELAAAREENLALRRALREQVDGSDGGGASLISALKTELESRIAEKDAEIARLSGELDSLRCAVSAVEAKEADNDLVSAMARDLDAAIVALAERDEEIKRLTESLRNRQGEPLLEEIHAAALRERDERIAELMQHENSARHEATELRRMLQEREAEFEAAHYELMALRKATEERDRLSHDYADISQTLVESRRRLKEQETKRESLEQELRAAENKLEATNAELQRLRAELAMRDQSADTTGEDAAAVLSEVAHAELIQQIEALKAQCEAATQRAWSLHHTLDRATSVIKQRDAQIEQLLAEVTELRAKETAHLAELETNRSHAVQLEAEQLSNKEALESALAALSERDQQIAVLNLEAQQWQSRLDESAGDVRRLAGERDAAIASLESERDRARAELAELRAALQSAQTELAHARARDDERTAEIQRLTERLDEASRQAEAAAFESEAERAKWQPMLAGYEETKAALDDLRTQMAARDEQIRTIQSELLLRDQALSAREAELADARATALDQKRTLENIEAELSKTRKSLAAAEETAQARSAELDAARRSIESLTAALDDRDTRIDDLDFQVAGLTATLRDKDAVAAKTEAELRDAFIRETDALKADLSSATAALAAREQELHDAQEALLAAQSAAAEAGAQWETAAAQLKATSDENDRLRETLERMTAQERDLRAALDHRTSEVETLLADLEEFRVRERAAIRDLDERTQQVQSLQVAMNRQAGELSAAIQAKTNLERAVAQHAAEKEALATQLAEAQARVVAKDLELDTARAESAAIQQKVEEANAVVERLWTEMNAQKAELERIQLENESFRQNADVYKVSNVDLEQQVRSLKSSLERLQSERDALELTADEVRKRADRLDIQLAELRASVAQREEERNHFESLALGSQEAAARLRAELEMVRAEHQTELDQLRAAQSLAEETAQRLEQELTVAQRAMQEAQAAFATPPTPPEETVHELEALRGEVRMLRAEAEALRTQRDLETQQLLKRLEETATQAANSSREIERLTGELDTLKTDSRESRVALEAAFRLHDALETDHDDLWKHAPTGDNGAAMTPELVGTASDTDDDQKVLVDALLRFLGRR